MRGIDVSIHNFPVDWRAVKKAGMGFAICRTGYGKTGVDESFAANVAGAHKAGLICGAYHYSYALNIGGELFDGNIIYDEKDKAES